ncbi:MAG: hypothetical protein HYS61_06550, partial [Acidobacteria bacterium]|nr:hypothetical protein [Acidobacteriota bacterium]
LNPFARKLQVLPGGKRRDADQVKSDFERALFEECRDTHIYYDSARKWRDKSAATVEAALCRQAVR